MFDNILKGGIDFEGPPWPEISEAGRDCIQKMLVHQPNKRWTARQLLEHEYVHCPTHHRCVSHSCHTFYRWINEDGVAPNKVISGVQSRVREFAGMNRLQQVARKVIAENLPMDEIEGLSNMFKNMDVDNSGNISAEELRNAYAGQSRKMPLEEFEKILKVCLFIQTDSVRLDDISRLPIWMAMVP